MKHYPSIPKRLNYETTVHVFDKLDGSNIRAEWNPKRGFYKFGSRKHLIDEKTFLGKSIALIKAHDPAFQDVFAGKNIQQVTCYFEFFGPKSFAGDHDPEDDHKVVLLDVEVYKQGFMAPADYLKAFQGLVPVPDVLYHGQLTESIVGQIENGTLPGMTFEGVVCKAPSFARWGLPIMFKIKNQAWIDKVIEKHGSNAAILLEKL